MRDIEERKCFYCNKWTKEWDCIDEGYTCFKCQAELGVKNINGN